MERERLEERVAAYLDGELTPPEAAELIEELRRDPEARRYLLRAAGTDVALHELAAAPSEVRGRASKSPARHTFRRFQGRRSWRGAPALAAAAALATATLLLWVLAPGRGPSPAAPRTTAKERVREEETPAAREPVRSPERQPAEPLKPVPEEKRDAPREELPPRKPAPPPPVEPPKPPERSPAPPKPPDPARPQTRTVIASVDRAEGACFVLVDGDRKPARAGTSLLSGHGLETSDAKSLAVVRLADGSRLEVGGNTLIRSIEEPAGAGTRVGLAAGTLAAEVARRPQERPLDFATPHAEARVLGTSLRLTVDGASTRLDVTEGKVRLTRAADAKVVDVPSGHYAVAGVGVDLVAKAYPRTLSFGGAGAKVQDTYVYGYRDYENNNFGARDRLMVSVNGPSVALLRVPTLVGSGAGQIPSRSTVLSATFRFKCVSNGPGTLLSVKLFRCLKPWAEGRGDGTTAQRGEATWKAAQHGVLVWETAGAEGRADRPPEPLAAAAKVDEAGFVTFDVAPIVQGWVRGEPNHGLLLTAASKPADLQFCSSEDAAPANRPLLTVEFSK